MKNRIVIALMLLVCFLTGCSRKEQLPENIASLLSNTSGSVIKVISYGDPGDLDPISYKYNSYSIMTGHFIHAAPLRRNLPQGYAPGLFKDYSCSVNSDGQLTVEGEWCENIKWHDGVAFSFKDLEYTFKCIGDKKFESPFNDLINDIISIENNEKKCKIVFKSDSVRYLDLLTVGLMPSHLLEPQTENATSAISFEQYCEKPIGLGPYKVSDRKIGSYLLLEKFDGFIDDKIASRTKNVFFKSGYDYETIFSETRKGKYDWANVPSALHSQIKNFDLKDVKLNCYDSNACLTILFNTKKSEISNPEIRRAIGSLIDREKIANIYGSFYALSCNKLYFSPLIEQNNKENIEKLKLNARETISKAGYTEQNPLSITMLVNDYSGKTVAEIIRDDLNQYSIHIDIKMVSWGEFVSKKLKSGDFTIALANLYLPSGGNWSNLIGTKQIADDNMNFTGTGNEEIDEIMKKLDSAVYNDNKETLKSKLSEYLDMNYPIAFLLKPYDLSIIPGESKEAAVKHYPICDECLGWPTLYGNK